MFEVAFESQDIFKVFSKKRKTKVYQKYFSILKLLDQQTALVNEVELRMQLQKRVWPRYGVSYGPGSTDG